MPTDATGTPTSPDNIPTYNTSVDAPSGLGFNAAMAQIQSVFSNNVARKPTGIVSGEVPVWNGTSWDRSSVTRIGTSSLGSGTPSSANFLRGDGTWAAPATGSTIATAVSGLGTATNGMIGRLRLGTTPFEYLDVVYDSTYAHWVSSEYAIWSTQYAGSAANAPGPLSLSPGGAGTFWIGAANTRFKNYTDAGLTPQIRMMGTASRLTTTFTFSLDLYHQTADNTTADSTRFQATWNSVSLANPGAGAYYAFDTGWASIPLPSPVKDQLEIVPRVDSAAGGTIDLGASIHLRWIG